MLKKLLKWPLALFLLSCLVAGLNFKSGVWLTGWDTLHPEFDFGLNFSRQLFGVWREDQGVGSLAAHAHMSELPRTAMLWLLHLVMPLESVRLVYVLFCFVLGPLGVYWFVRNSVLKKANFAEQAAFVSGLWYIFNLGTAQHFVVVFEMFAVQYAAVGWLFWMGDRVIRQPTRKNLLWFGLICLLSAPQAYASQLWFVLFGGLLSYLFVITLLSGRRNKWKSLLLALVVVVGMNSFWLLPNLYFLKNGAGRLQEAFINKTFSPESFVKNQEFGTLSDLVLLKNFLFDFKIYRTESGFEEVMQVWKDYLALPLITPIGWIVFGIAMVGLSVGLWKKEKHLLALIPSFGLTVFALINANPPFTTVFNWLREQSVLFAEGFRTPFTKFSILYMLCFSVFLGIGQNLLLAKMSKVSRKIFIGLVVVSLVYFGWPLFRGQLIHPLLKAKIPENYFLLFDYAKNVSHDRRMALLPLGSPWGWEYHDWGYQGPGFTWFGMSQPILTRDFDRWSPNNETFYNELSTVFYYCPPKADENQVDACAKNVGRVFDKYQVSLALLDESVILPGQDNRVMRYELWKKILAKLDPQADFKSGSLSLYTVGNNSTGITIPEKFQTINAETTYGRFEPFYNQDVAYVQRNLGGYVSYPFAGITRENLSKLISYSDNELVTVEGIKASGKKLVFPKLTEGEVIRGRIRATLTDRVLSVEILPFGELKVGDQAFPFWLDKKLEVELKSSIGSAKIAINNKSVVVGINQPTELSGIEMKAGEPVVINVYEAGGREIKIASSSAKLGVVKAGQLIEVDTNQRICLGFEQLNYQCYNQENLLVAPKQGIYWLDLLDQNGTTLPSVKIFEPVTQYEFSSQIWEEIKQEFELNNNNVKQEIRWESVVQPKNIEYRIENKESEQQNCDVLKRGTASKRMAGESIEYRSDGYGAFCDSWWVKPIEGEGILRLKGKNVSGRGLKLSQFSTTENRTILEQLLPSGGNFDVTFGYLTGLADGSTINLETKSFGSIKGINQLDSAQIYPLSLTWLQKIKVGQDEIMDNQLEILETKKWGTGIYKIKVSGNGLLVLNQGFDKGWISMGLNHIKVNGWANGFVVPPGTKDQELGTVYIFFWPQILEWLGLGLLGVGGVLIISSSRLTKNG